MILVADGRSADKLDKKYVETYDHPLRVVSYSDLPEWEVVLEKCSEPSLVVTAPNLTLSVPARSRLSSTASAQLPAGRTPEPAERRQ